MRLRHAEPSPVCYEVSDKQRRPLAIPVCSVETLNDVHLQVICLLMSHSQRTLFMGITINGGAK
jgi:hypothetical protein